MYLNYTGHRYDLATFIVKSSNHDYHDWGGIQFVAQRCWESSKRENVARASPMASIEFNFVRVCWVSFSLFRILEPTKRSQPHYRATVTYLQGGVCDNSKWTAWNYTITQYWYQFGIGLLRSKKVFCSRLVQFKRVNIACGSIRTQQMSTNTGPRSAARNRNQFFYFVISMAQ